MQRMHNSTETLLDSACWKSQNQNMQIYNKDSSTKLKCEAGYFVLFHISNPCFQIKAMVYHSTVSHLALDVKRLAFFS
jgi:uncharacterized protein Smg (DUF494 family)